MLVRDLLPILKRAEDDDDITVHGDSVTIKAAEIPNLPTPMFFIDYASTWAALMPYIMYTGRRNSIGLSVTMPADGRRHILDIVTPCAACGVLMHPFRERVGKSTTARVQIEGEADQGKPTVTGIFYSATCSDAISGKPKTNCARKKTATLYKDAVDAQMKRWRKAGLFTYVHKKVQA